MSMEAMNAFLEKAQADEAVASQLVAIIDENEGEAIYSRVVSLADDNGFAVTEADVKETQAQFVKAVDSDEAGAGDLNDDDLEKVAGGLAPMAVAAQSLKTAQLSASLASTVAHVGVNSAGQFFKKW